MPRILALSLILVVASRSAAPARSADPPPTERAPERTETSPEGTFSITFPSSWRALPTTHGGYDQLGLFADEPFDISIVVASRALDETERALDRRQLLDRMIELTMIRTVELGNEIVEVGRVAPLAEDWPAFAAVVTTPDRSKIITILRSFLHDRTYVVTTMTDNLQGSSELGATVTGVVRSLTLHPPEPAAAALPDPSWRPFCERWQP